VAGLEEDRLTMSEIETLLGRGDVPAAAKLVEQRLDNPDDMEALLAAARLQMLVAEYEKADRLIARAEAAKAPEAPVWRAILAEAVGAPHAIQLLEEVVQTARRPEPHFVLGRALNQRNEFARARPHLERAVTLNPENALAHFQLAYALMEVGSVQAGLQHLETAIKLNPRYTPAIVVMARMLAGNGQPSDARNLLDQGLQINPGDEDLQRELASVAAAP
jgi:tetratricopeptide (TPR) repeat protein